MSIKALAENLKTSNSDVSKVAKTIEVLKTDPKAKSKKKKKKCEEIPEFFIGLKKEIKEKEYNNTSNTYIDTEIGEVLATIKQRGKIGISSLLSHIVEEWILLHHNEIQSLPTNKYLK